MLQTGAAWLSAKRHQRETRPVIYRRGINTVVLNATAGRTPFEQVEISGIVHQTESSDWLIRAADLVINDNLTDPQEGDQIIEGNKVYEVMSPTVGEPPWRKSGHEGLTIRIHTKLVGTE